MLLERLGLHVLLPFSPCCFNPPGEEVLECPPGNELVPSLSSLGRVAESVQAEARDAADCQHPPRMPRTFSVHSGDGDSMDENISHRHLSLTEEEKRDEMAKVQELIREFVQTALRGSHIDVVLEDGTLTPCRFSMDGQLSVITLQVHALTRHIPMTDIQEVSAGRELRGLETTTPVDENCCTLVLSNGTCVSFSFPDEARRERFATCMKVLRLALD
mmetsp:Transcript_86565/g.273198  ORF Transcript_86565/g.273198 Transcript_86565/m.273198 type:complete len:217 (-) Transcript_86565:121-771(-)